MFIIVTLNIFYIDTHLEYWRKWNQDLKELESVGGVLLMVIKNI